MRLSRSILVGIAITFTLAACPGEDVVDAPDTTADVGDTAVEDTAPDDVVDDTGGAVDTLAPDSAEPDSVGPTDTGDDDTSDGDTGVTDTVTDDADTVTDTHVPPPTGETCDQALVVDALPYAVDVDTSALADDLSTGGACDLGGDRGAGAGDLVVAFTAETSGLYRWSKAEHGGAGLIYAASACDGAGLSGCDGASGDLWSGGAWTFWLDAGDTRHFVIDGWFPTDQGPTALTLDAVDATSCASYCGLVTTACTGADAQYASYAHCLGYCEDWAALPAGDPAAEPANSVACRAHEAALALTDTAHCAAAGPSGGGTCGTLCESYCHLYANNCDGLAPAFDDGAACLAACADLDDGGPQGATTGDTLQCRLYHLAVAGSDPEGAADHCASGAIDGGTACGDTPMSTGAGCADALAVTAVPYLHLGTTVGAGADAAFSDGACPGTPSGRGGAGQDRVYAFTPEATGRYRVALAEADFDAALYAATTCEDVDGSCLAAADVAGPGGERLTLDLVAGTPVYLFVDGWSDSEDVSGSYRLTVERLDPSECATYCSAVMTTCTGADAQYPSYEACAAACADVPPGDADETSQEGADTVACRTAEAELAASDPAHCAAAGPTGAGVCGDLCDSYCRLAGARCAIYDDDDACLTACAGFSTAGDLDDGDGDTVQCRLTQALAADDDPARCAAAAAESGVCVDPPPATGDTCADPIPVTAFPFTDSGAPTGLNADLDGCDGSAAGPDQVFAVTAAVAGVYPITLESAGFDRVYTLEGGCQAGACAETDRLVLAPGQTTHLVIDATSPAVLSTQRTLTIGAPDPASCFDYCAVYGAGCAALSPYADEGACVDACLAANRPGGALGDSDVDTTACRTYYAGLAMAGDTAACVAAGPDGGGVCGTFCDVYCGLAMTQCQGDDRIYDSAESCATVCPYLPLVGRPGDHVGDSLFCRTSWLAEPQFSAPAQGSTVDRCVVGGVTGGTICSGGVAGDTCADPVEVDALPFYLPGDTSAWSDDSSTTGACGDDADHGAGTGDLVIRFRPAQAGDYRWSKLGAGGPGMLQLATDCADLATSCLGTSGDLWAGGDWTVTLAADTDYYFVLDGWLADDEGPFTLLLEATP